KGQFVVMTDADFEAADVEATQTIDIRDFVVAAEIPPVYFEQPYYLEPQKTGAKAYALLREALRRSGRVGVATVVLRQREHLAAVQAAGDAMTLTTMRFAHEIATPSGPDLPPDAASRPRRARALHGGGHRDIGRACARAGRSAVAAQPSRRGAVAGRRGDQGRSHRLLPRCRRARVAVRSQPAGQPAARARPDH